MNIRGFLSEHKIWYKTKGKNVTRGWVNITCPFCNDQSNHMGISPHGYFNCWKCGENGNINYLISELLDISYSEAKSISSQVEFEEHEKEYVPRPEKISFDFKPIGTKEKNYLKKRNFNPDFIEWKYNIKSGGTFGYFHHRIVIPYYIKNKIATLSGRDYTNRAKIKYRHYKEGESLFTAKEIPYNLNNITKKRVALVEGCTDVWNIGDNSVSTSGTSLSDYQMNFLLACGVKRIFAVYDPEPDAQMKAQKDSYLLSAFFETEIVNIGGDKDPGDLCQTEIKHLRKELKL